METLNEFIAARFDKKQDFAKAIGASKQWVTTMCSRGYIVANGKVYSPRFKLGKEITQKALLVE